MTYSYLKIGGTDEVRQITLARSEIRNAFNAELIRQITAALREMADDRRIRVLVLAAEGKVFCAGADFHWMAGQKDATMEQNLDDAGKLFDMFQAMYDFPCPTIARVQGGAYGGGAGLMACADFVIMSDDAVSSFSEVRIGLVPATISPFVIRKIGLSHAREVFLTGMMISAQKALDIKLANAVVPVAELDKTVDEQVAALLRCGPEAQRATKRLIEDVAHLPIHETRDETARVIAAQRISDEGQEGMSAFLEKRKPNWNR
ncbi:MAG: enoyl-CoA hydratase-related protein [Calditrichota bacterium]